MTGTSEQSRREIETRWQWASAIPSSLPRSELIRVELPAQAVTCFAPQALPTAVRTVSWSNQPPDFTIQQVGDFRVRNLGELDSAVSEIPLETRTVRVALSRCGSGSSAPPSYVDLPPRTLRALQQAATPGSQVVRYEQIGTSAALIRQGGLRCKLQTRVERHTGLVQLIVEIENYWGQPVLSPKDVNVRCEGTPLRCLSVAETLELLYGNKKNIVKMPEAKLASFAVVAEREDYLVPSNCKRLEAEYQKHSESNLARQLQPALISIPGKPYPGSPVVGDARALTNYALQPRIINPGDEPLRGWILFAGSAVSKAQTFDVLLNLTDQQPLTISFAIPRD